MTLHLRAFWLACLARLADCSAFERAFWLANVKYKGLQVGEIFSQLLFATCSLAVPLAWLTGLRGSLFWANLAFWLTFGSAFLPCLLPRRFVILSFR